MARMPVTLRGNWESPRRVDWMGRLSPAADAGQDLRALLLDGDGLAGVIDRRGVDPWNGWATCKRFLTTRWPEYVEHVIQ